MQLSHFELLKPVCPVCRAQTREPKQLILNTLVRQDTNNIIEGILCCPEPACRHEFPILDGIPIIVPQLRPIVSGWIDRIRARDSFSESLESLLGDCCGSGSGFDDERQRRSSYTWDHWGEFDPAINKSVGQITSPGAIARLLKQGIDLFPKKLSTASGPGLDMGCAVGRTTYELADHLQRPVVGIDLDISLLRRAQQIHASGIVEYPLRRTGLAYDRHTFSVANQYSQTVKANIDFWCCDVTALPFSDNLFSFTSSLNVLDCVHSPLTALQEIERTLEHTGRCVLASPYDWSTSATPTEAWIGGHSQRTDTKGSPATIIRQLLNSKEHPASLHNMHLVNDTKNASWQVRLHERATMNYSCDMLAIEKLRQTNK